MNRTCARTARGLPLDFSAGISSVTHDPAWYSYREGYKHPWQFTDTAEVDSRKEFPNRLWPQTLIGTALLIRVLRRALPSTARTGAFSATTLVIAPPPRER